MKFSLIAALLAASLSTTVAAQTPPSIDPTSGALFTDALPFKIRGLNFGTIGTFDKACRAEMSRYPVAPEKDKAPAKLVECINLIAPWVTCPVNFKPAQFWVSYDGAKRDIPGMQSANLSMPVAATVVIARYAVCAN